jgi:hypothetical protein
MWHEHENGHRHGQRARIRTETRILANMNMYSRRTRKETWRHILIQILDIGVRQCLARYRSSWTELSLGHRPSEMAKSAANALYIKLNVSCVI